MTTKVLDPAPAAIGDLRDLAQSFQRHLRAHRAAKTCMMYMEAVDQLLAFLVAQGMPTDAVRITREHVEHWYISLIDSGRSDSTLRNRDQALRSFFNFLVAEGEIGVSPMRNMPRPRIAEKLVPMPTLDAVKALLATCGSKSFLDVRDAAIIRLLLATGMRRGELLGLRVEDMDLDQMQCIVVGKGNRSRKVPFNGRALDALDRYMRARRRRPNATLPELWIAERGGGTFNESGLATMLRRRSDQAGVPKIHPHLFRHLFAHTWQAQGRNETDLMQLAGWKNREMLSRYVSSAAAERAIDAYRRSSPMDDL